ncbi:MAG: tRNA-dihydrouridine synthase, partial [Candidatus Moraniibacteriota bacterium]
CALMPQPELARQIISAVCENTKLPVSIKIRAGVKNFNALEFIEKTKDLPYCAVMVHGRTYEGGFSGEVDWKIISKIKKMVPEKIILGNGGITTPETALEILQKYPEINGLGIARGVWGRPYLFSEIKEFFENKKHTVYDFKKIKKIMIRHAKLIFADKKDFGLFEIRKHLVWYIKGFSGASELRKKLVRAESVEEIKEILNQNH